MSRSPGVPTIYYLSNFSTYNISVLPTINTNVIQAIDVAHTFVAECQDFGDRSRNIESSSVTFEFSIVRK